MKEQREIVVEKINWYKSAIANTKSPYLKRDYQKAIRRMQKELKFYDEMQKANNKIRYVNES